MVNIRDFVSMAEQELQPAGFGFNKSMPFLQRMANSLIHFFISSTKFIDDHTAHWVWGTQGMDQVLILKEGPGLWGNSTPC